MKCALFLLVYLAFAISYATPARSLTPESICAGIDSSKYQAQCEKAIHNKHFDFEALKICANEKGGYDIKSCMEVISDRTYTSKDLQTWLSGKRVRLQMCLFKSGTSYVAPVDEVSGGAAEK
jgi:hypothetical protein